jgi:serine protease Do
MSNRKSTFFYAVLIGLGSLVAGMVLASRLDLTPESLAGNLYVPATNSAPLAGVPFDSSTFRNIAKDAGPAVVSIQITSAVPANRSLGDLFGFGDQLPRPGAPGGRRGAPQAAPDLLPARGAGSGFIIDKAGYILTNNHVVEDARTIEVHLAGMNDLEEGLPAKVIGRDPLTDTALIQLTQLPREPLAVAKFGDSSQLAAGDWVMAIGNPFTLANSVTVGVVSAVGRLTQAAVAGRYEEMIQTDAAINRGNSGGPLLNIRGEVIGINTKILTDDGTGNVGVGFAIPINTVKDLLPQLESGKITRGRIGVNVYRNPISDDVAESFGLPNTNGAIIRDVSPGPAADAGIKPGDVIVEFNGKTVHDNNELVAIVTRTAPGTTVPVKLYRDKKLMTVNVKVAELDLVAEQELTGGRPDRRERQQPEPAAPKQTKEFGLSFSSITPALSRDFSIPQGVRGAVVTDVDPFGSAAQAGIAPGDVIVSVDGQAVSTPDQAAAALDKVAAGKIARVMISRGGQETLTLVRKR